MVNYSTEENRRVDFVFGIGYGDDIDKARSVIEKMVAADGRVFKDPAPQIVVAELGDSSVNFKVRLWAKASDYWDIYFEYTENVKKAFDAEGLNIPFPQMDVHVHNA
jgi:small conductance mechanosensitive channel